jgi:thymidine phosphorylase
VAALSSGAALGSYEAMVRAQGGDPSAPLPDAPHRETLAAPATGRLRRLDAFGVGLAAWRLGAGRAKKEDSVSPSAGVVCLAKPGDAVEEGQPLLELRAEDPARFAGAVEALEGAIEVGPQPAEPSSVVIEVIRS